MSETSKTPQVLLDLLAARGPSGYESAPAGVWREAAGAFAQVSTDVVGTPLALVAARDTLTLRLIPRLWCGCSGLNLNSRLISLRLSSA